MSKMLAYFFVITAGFFIGLGNFWFTYGIWPRSWWSFTIFVLLSITNGALLTALQKEK